MTNREVVLSNPVRTAIGTCNGCLKDVSAGMPGATVIREILKRDTFFSGLAHELHEHFETTHPTLQIDLDCVDHGCKLPLK